MNKIIPHHLTLADFLKHRLAHSDSCPEHFAASIGNVDPKLIAGVLAGTLKLPAALIFPIADFLNIDPPHIMRIYLRDYLPELERALHDCGGLTVVTEREKTLLEAYRRSTGDTDPEVLIFEDKRVVALALA